MSSTLLELVKARKLYSHEFRTLFNHCLDYDEHGLNYAKTVRKTIEVVYDENSVFYENIDHYRDCVITYARLFWAADMPINGGDAHGLPIHYVWEILDFLKKIVAIGIALERANAARIGFVPKIEDTPQPITYIIQRIRFVESNHDKYKSWYVGTVTRDEVSYILKLYHDLDMTEYTEMIETSVKSKKKKSQGLRFYSIFCQFLIGIVILYIICFSLSYMIIEWNVPVSSDILAHYFNWICGWIFTDTEL
jgi:hypothetical protein